MKTLLLTAMLMAVSCDLRATCGNNDPDGVGGPGDCNSKAGTNPIKVYSGNVHREITDLEVWGGVGEHQLALKRYGDSRYKGGLHYFGVGHNWRHSYQWEISDYSKQGPTDLQVIMPDGREVIFQRVSSTQWVSAAQIPERIFQNGDDYTIQFSNGWKYHFTRQDNTGGGNLYLMRDFSDTQGNNYQFTYNSANLLTRVTEPGGRYLQFTHTVIFSRVLITQVATSDGRTATYTYQPAGGVPGPVPSTAGVLSQVQYGDGTTATYTYQAPEVTNGFLLLTSAIDPRYRGPAVNMKYEYTAGGTEIAREINGVTGETMATLTTLDNANKTVTYGNGAVQKFEQPATMFGLLNSKTDGLGRKSSFTYDQGGVGFLASSTAPLNRTTTYTRSAWGNLLSQTNPDGSTESWTREPDLDLVLTHADELGRVTTYTRNASHRVTRIDHPDASYETFTYNGFSQVLSHRLRNGGTESNVYDARGLKTSMMDALGKVTGYTYDASDRLASVTDARNNTTRYEYNERGLMTKVTHADGSFASYTYDGFGSRLTVTNEIGKTWTSTYDEFKRLTSVTDPLNRKTMYDYTLPGQACGCTHVNDHPTKITLPSGKATVITYDAEWQKVSETAGSGTPDAATTQYAYDPFGNVLTLTDPRGKLWNYTYDNRNRRVTASDPLGNITQWTYDAAGNRLTEKRPAPDNGITTNVYDAMNRLQSTTDPKNQTTAFTYGGTNASTKGDNLITLTDASSHTYSFEYDLLDRKIKMIYPDTSFEQWTFNDTAPAGQIASTYKTRASQTMSFTLDNRNRDVFCDWSDTTPDITKAYDAAGRLTQLSTSVSQLTYSYDIANQLLSETQAVASLPAKTVSYDYDADGNRSALTYPDGTAVAYAYTARNQVASITAGGPPPLASYTYDPNGNRLTKTLENGTSASYIYDDANRLTTLDHKKGAASFAKFEYVLNSVNNRTSRKETDAGIPAVTDTYSYDAIDQIATVGYGTGRNVGYNYDATGNRLTVQDSAPSPIQPLNYSTNPLNQYTQADGNALSYDASGNLTGYNGWTYAYDAQNRLTSVSGGPSSVTATFSYDGRNRCVKRSLTLNNQLSTTYYLYDSWNLICERGASDQQLNRYIHGTAIDELLAKISPAGAVYYHQDALGSTTQLTDPNGNVAESYAYDVYGAATIKNAAGAVIMSSATGNRFLFTGREWIKEVNLYDYRNRMYSQELGRFLQTDPFQFYSGDVNLFRYVRNNAVQCKDNYGLDPNFHNTPPGLHPDPTPTPPFDPFDPNTNPFPSPTPSPLIPPAPPTPNFHTPEADDLDNPFSNPPYPEWYDPWDPCSKDMRVASTSGR